MEKSRVIGKRRIPSGTPGNFIWQVLRRISCPADREMLLWSACSSGAVIALISFVFYDSWLAVPFLLPLSVPVSRWCAAYLEGRRRGEMTAAFREMMADLLTNLRAGYSVENALRDCRQEMAVRFGEGAGIVRELTKVANGLNNRIPVEQLMQQFAKDTGVEEIREFAEVFAIARRSSGNLTDILQRTMNVLQNRMETESEIQVLIAGRKLEQHIMDAVPFVIILYIRLTSPGFFDVLYHNTAGIGIMSICLAVYLAAVILSERLTEIHV